MFFALVLPAFAVTPGGAYGTATETCTGAAPTVVSWSVQWRPTNVQLFYGLTATGDGGWYQREATFTGMDALWTFGDTELPLDDGTMDIHVTTLTNAQGGWIDTVSLQHDESLADVDVIGGWATSGRDFGTVMYTEGPLFEVPDTTLGTLDITVAGDRVCTYIGTIEGWVPQEVCDDGTDEDGDGLVDGDDPDCQACGDGILQPGEACDDGNNWAGDTCDPTCALEPDADTDGVPDFRDRCPGEDDTVDADENMRPDCLPPVTGGYADGTASGTCTDASGLVTPVSEIPWSATWDWTTGTRTYYADEPWWQREYAQFDGTDAVWVLDGTAWSTSDGYSFVENGTHPEMDGDRFDLNGWTVADGLYYAYAMIYLAGGDFLAGDVATGDVGVDIVGARDRSFEWYRETSDGSCRLYGTVDHVGDIGPDGDGIPEPWDLCPDEDASGWDRDWDGCIDDTDGDGFLDPDDVCPAGDDLADDDGDGAPEACDICPGDPLNDQDGDGLCTADDACPADPAGDDDADGDTVCNSDDHCNAGSPDWLGVSEDDLYDLDGDGVADGCDLCVDMDHDEACTTVDACLAAGLGGDADVDGVCDDEDACPLDYLDDSDGDGACDRDDVCPGVDDFVDSDGDGLVDCRDSCPADVANDADGDGVCEDVDVCPGVPDPDQSDADGDGLGDACEPDADGDGVDDTFDNCAETANPAQTDTDNDGLGDVCDGDDDGDGVLDATDRCDGSPADPTLPDGCTVEQTCPTTTAWKNTGAYNKCVSDAADVLVATGELTKDQAKALKKALKKG